jgi:hypothetical protein
MDRYRIEGIQKATVNGQDCVLFKAYELNQAQDAYVFAGQFKAPKNTPKAKLENFINQGVDDENQ